MAVNPEMGFFGVVPGTNLRSNFVAMATINRDTIYTNVALKPDGTVWWKATTIRPGRGPGLARPTVETWPQRQGRQPDPVRPPQQPFHRSLHQLSDPLLPLQAAPRRAHRCHHLRWTPGDPGALVYQALDWNHGVYMGASMASERTAAQFGALGEVRRDPMAMLPFCGYNMATTSGTGSTWACGSSTSPRSSM